MPYDQLMQYVHTAKLTGASDQHIADRLRTAGWYSVDVQDALVLYRKLTTPERLTARLTSLAPTRARTYDPGLVAVIILSFIIGFVGFLLVR